MATEYYFFKRRKRISRTRIHMCSSTMASTRDFQEFGPSAASTSECQDANADNIAYLGLAYRVAVDAFESVSQIFLATIASVEQRIFVTMSSPASSRRRGHSSRKSQSSTPAKSQLSQPPQTSSPLFFRSSSVVAAPVVDQDATPRASGQAPAGGLRCTLDKTATDLSQNLRPCATAPALSATSPQAAATSSPARHAPMVPPLHHITLPLAAVIFTPTHLPQLPANAAASLLAKMASQSVSQAPKLRSRTSIRALLKQMRWAETRRESSGAPTSRSPTRWRHSRTSFAITQRSTACGPRVQARKRQQRWAE